MWSDECWIERSKDPRTVWVFRTPAEKWRTDLIEPYAKQGDAKVMIWSLFCGENKGPLHVCEETLNQYNYLDILQQNMVDFAAENVQIDDISGEQVWPIFMQDNAPVHRARTVREWLRDCEYVVLEWPPYSPDLNPIEHAWKLLKDAVHRLYPDLKKITHKPTAIARIKEIIANAWESIDGHYFKKLVESMPARIQAVIDARGWYTKY